jgi:hypothetical protein
MLRVFSSKVTAMEIKFAKLRTEGGSIGLGIYSTLEGKKVAVGTVKGSSVP